ncbi:DUF3800 domain-containing protein [Candidatus Methylomirabilis sp.]|uniref:DUF3800 domain-containing protein n=1 Tax=Candidatus Methylomirabilis tolerans TaxID=3123416 RepID=A0AAJ1AGT4_9BACT|nr:DUF3800 domain-containing protein [Candidatus Methylomirabilis sp.]
MTTPSFRVYVDESGDEGFVFKPDGAGSSRWLVLSAVVTRREEDHVVVGLMDKVRTLLGRPRRQQLHFVKLGHAQRTAYARTIGQARIRTVSVLIHKPSIRDPETFQAQKHQLYRYACRLLLERVSWLCRDHHIRDRGDGTADIIFSNRGQMSYDDLRAYLQRLKEMSAAGEVNIEWSVINPKAVSAVQHTQRAGLQVADAVASSVYAAVNPNQFGDTEDRYLRAIVSVCYRYQGRLLGYGLKFWPDDLTSLQKENPQLAWLTEGLR